VKLHALLAFSLLLAAAGGSESFDGAQPVSAQCEIWRSKFFALSFCKPPGWYVEDAYNHVFLCNGDPKTCTTSGGGFPNRNVANILIGQGEEAQLTRGFMSEERIRILRRRDPDLSIRVFMQSRDGAPPYQCQEIKTVMKFGIAPRTLGLARYIYYAQFKLRTVGIELEFWEDDKRSDYYLEQLRGILSSLKEDAE